MINTADYPRLVVSPEIYYSLGRGGSDLQRAIQFAKEHREIHLRWIDYLRAHPPRTKEERLTRRTAGGIRHQEIAVRRYDVIIRALEAVI